MSIRPRKTYSAYVPYNTAIYKLHHAIKAKYGLNNKAAIMKVEAKAERYRNIAKTYKSDSANYQNALAKVIKKGILVDSTNLLDITVDAILKRCLCTIVAEQYNITVGTSRQKITSGHVLVDGVKQIRPSSLINKNSIITLM